MTPAALIYTAVLLGFFVLAGGGYGGLYSAGRLRSSRKLIRAGFLCYLVAASLAVAICLYTPLAPLWKTFVLVSGFAYAVIPPLTWRCLDKLHQAGEDTP